MSQPGRRVAFFGGSFDPPHMGHLAVARAAQAALRLDTVLFAPVGAQPLKSQGAMASYEDRVAMTRLAIAGEAGFDVSLADGPKLDGAPNYTLETLSRLHGELGASCLLFLLMGADSFLGIRSWHRAAEIPFAARLIVASRPGQPLKDLTAALPAGLSIGSASEQSLKEGGVEAREFVLRNQHGRAAEFYLLPGLDVPVSASEIRARIREQGAQTVPLKPALLAQGVREYVQIHDLYR